MKQGYQNYKAVSIETASDIKLLIMLYRGAIKFLSLAIQSVQEKDYSTAHLHILKVQDILSEFIASLNFEAGDLADQLMSLYVYMNRRLIEANLKKNQKHPENNIFILEEVSNLMETLVSGWEELLLTESLHIHGDGNTSKRLDTSG